MIRGESLDPHFDAFRAFDPARGIGYSERAREQALGYRDVRPLPARWSWYMWWPVGGPMCPVGSNETREWYRRRR